MTDLGERGEVDALRRVIPHFTLLVGLHVSGFVVRPALYGAGRSGNETRRLCRPMVRAPRFIAEDTLKIGRWRVIGLKES